jgi:hypothetical protein
VRCPRHLQRLPSGRRSRRHPRERAVRVARRRDGRGRQLAVPSRLDRVRHHHPGGRDAARVREGVQPDLRDRRHPHAPVLPVAAHHRADPARPRRPEPRRTRPSQKRARLVPGHHAGGPGVADHRPALHRHHPGRRRNHEEHGRQDRRARRRIGRADHGLARRRRDPHHLPGRTRDRLGRHRLAVSIDPQGALAGGDRARPARVLRLLLGRRQRLDRQMCDVRPRPDPVEIGAGGDLPGRRHPGLRPHLHRPGVGLGPAGRHRPHGPGRIQPVHGLPVPQLCGRGPVQPDGRRTGHQNRPEPAPAHPHHGVGRRTEENTRRQHRQQRQRRRRG